MSCWGTLVFVVSFVPNVFVITQTMIAGIISLVSFARQ